MKGFTLVRIQHDAVTKIFEAIFQRLGNLIFTQIIGVQSSVALLLYQLHKHKYMITDNEIVVRPPNTKRKIPASGTPTKFNTRLHCVHCGKKRALRLSFLFPFGGPEGNTPQVLKLNVKKFLKASLTDRYLPLPKEYMGSCYQCFGTTFFRMDDKTRRLHVVDSIDLSCIMVPTDPEEIFNSPDPEIPQIANPELVVLNEGGYEEVAQ